jgi:hypothetical protein
MYVTGCCDRKSEVGLEVFAEVTMKNAVFWDVAPCGLVKTDVSGERVASIFRVEQITQARC